MWTWLTSLTRKISIHTLRVEGDQRRRVAIDCPVIISIHTLRVEGDLFVLFPLDSFRISIHTLRVEGDHDRPTPIAN